VRRSYTKACMGRRKYEREELTDVMRQAQTSAQKWQRELKDAVRRYDEASRKLEQQDGDDERFAEMLNAEFDAIIEEDNKVVSMDCLGDNILVETENLYCIDPRSGHEHDIGAFRFVIEQEKASVKFYNMTRRVRGYNNRLMHAPHVFTNGNPCLGDQSVDIPQFVARFQWRALIDRCVRYLQSVFVKDAAGSCIVNWPISRTKEQIEEEERRAARNETLMEVAEAATEEALNMVTTGGEETPN